MNDILTSSLFEEDIEKMMQAMKEATDKKIFEERKESGDIKEDFALILNPKYKDIIPELWYEAGIIIPIVWNPFAEEGKCYVVTDKDFVMDARANMHKQYFGGRAKDFLMSDTVKQKLENSNTGVFELDYMDSFLPQYEGEWITDKKEE